MHFNSLVLPLALALAMAGCASSPRSDLLAADAPRALPEAGPVSVRWNDPATFADLEYKGVGGDERERARVLEPAGAELLDVLVELLGHH